MFFKVKSASFTLARHNLRRKHQVVVVPTEVDDTIESQDLCTRRTV